MSASRPLRFNRRQILWYDRSRPMPRGVPGASRRPSIPVQAAVQATARPASLPSQAAAQASALRPASIPAMASTAPAANPASGPSLPAAVATAQLVAPAPSAPSAVDAPATAAPPRPSAPAGGDAASTELTHRALEMLGQNTLKLVADLLSADRIALVLDSGRRWIEPAALGGPDPIPAGVVRQVRSASSGGVLISDAASDARFMNATGLAAGIRTALAVQVRAGEEVFGILFAGLTGNRTFRAMDMRLLEGLASQAGVVVMAMKAMGSL